MIYYMHMKFKIAIDDLLLASNVVSQGLIDFTYSSWI